MRELLAKPYFRNWLAIAGSVTLVLLTAYVFIQQSTRASAVTAPRALNQELKTKLDGGISPVDLVAADKIAIDKNYNTFVIITDSSNHVLASSATLDNQTPLPPAGVFSYTAAHGSDTVSWQPKSGVRAAIYVSSYGDSDNKGFVIAGRSLKPYEDQVNLYTKLVIVAWLASVAWISYWILLPEYRK